MNWGIILVLLGAGLLLGALLLGPYLFPDENEQALQRLVEVTQAWAGVQDLQATLTLTKPGEPTLRLEVRYLPGLALRLEILEPAGLRGEVYALRPVPEGWLLVHFRPSLSLGLEARFPKEALPELLGGFGAISLDRIRVSWLAQNIARITGLAGAFPTVEIELSENFRLPQRIRAVNPQGQTVEVKVEEVAVNTGLELRELLILEPFPSRWIRIPIPASGV
ncbi:MAG: hypothetical protein NZ651_01010 [Candidatus Bipolaricaulota bacterium]|nr:hypothetical protein [Candidatus Bipolaricaulota bacterium]MDW8126347.1 hypothetical protein [Candidatus Bipolaricaulota bacterium]